MGIAWQDIFYVVATLSMVVVVVAFIWILRILYSLSMLFSNLVHASQKMRNGIGEIKNLRKNVTLGILGKIIHVLDKGGEYEK